MMGLQLHLFMVCLARPINRVFAVNRDRLEGLYCTSRDSSGSGLRELSLAFARPSVSRLVIYRK